MHPIELMYKYSLSYTQLAEFFAVSEQAARRWGFREGAKGKTYPTPMAFKLAEFIDRDLAQAK